jgi:hypothetical protein
MYQDAVADQNISLTRFLVVSSFSWTLTNSVELSPSGETYSWSATQEISSMETERPLLCPKSRSLILILSQMNLVLTLQP